MSFLTETNFSDVEILNESDSSISGGLKSWYIRGPFAQQNVINRNKRLYPGDVLSESMGVYCKDYLAHNRAVGELNHPETTKINPERISHRIESIINEGDDWIGKAKVLNTPQGLIVQSLLEGGIKLGVSTRADGKVKKNIRGYDEVTPGMRMRAIDIVYDPSAHKAMVEGLMEGEKFIWDSMRQDEELLEEIRQDVLRTKSSELAMAKVAAFKRLIDHIKTV